MNTIQKLVTIGEDSTLKWHLKGEWISESGNVITIDPDIGIDRNGVPIGGGGGPIPPILTPEKVVIDDNQKHVTISGPGGLVVSRDSGGSTTVNDTGVRISAGGTLAIGTSTLGAPLLSMLQATNNTTTGNIVLGNTKSLLIGDQSLTRNGLVELNTTIPNRLNTLDAGLVTLEGEVVTLFPLPGRVSALETTVASHGTRLTDVETGLETEALKITILADVVDQNRVVAAAGITILTGRVDDVEDNVSTLESRVISVEGIANDATTTANAANLAATTAQDTADTALDTATTAQNTADSASTIASAAINFATIARNAADAAQNTADTALDTATTALTTATTAQSTANTALTTATAAQTTANTALSTATNAQSTANTALTTATTAQETADDAATIAQGAATTADEAKTTADAADATANTARDDIVGLKSVDVTFDNRITALENAGGGGEPVVLPFYAKPSSIDFGTGNTVIGQSSISLGDVSTLSMGSGSTIGIGINTNMNMANGSKIAMGSNTSLKLGNFSSIALGATESVSLNASGTLNLGNIGSIAAGQTTLGSTGLLNLGLGGILRMGSTSLNEEGLKACNKLSSIEAADITEDSRVMIYTPVGAGSIEYSNLPASSFQNPEWADVDGPTFSDPEFGETKLRTSILTLDDFDLTSLGVKAAMDLGNDIRTPFTPGMIVATRNPANGIIRTTVLPPYITNTGLVFGSNVIGQAETETLGNLSSLQADTASTNYVSFDNTTGVYSFQAKPTFINTVNNVVGNMGGTGGATEAYLTRNGVTFGSATLFDPTENTCYGRTALTVVDRTQGTTSQRKKATFDHNGIVLSNPLATSIDDPATITLNRAKLALIQRIAAIDVISSTDTAPTSTKRMLVGDKISGSYSYATIPVVPTYLGANSITIGDTSIVSAGVTAGPSSLTNSGIVYSGAGSTITRVNASGVTVVSNTGTDSIVTTPTTLTFTQGASTSTLNRADVDYLKTNFLNVGNAAAITDVDAGGAIRFLAGPSAGGTKKFLAVPESYSWLKPTSISGSLVSGTTTRTASFLPSSVSLGFTDSESPTSNTTATLESNRLIISAYFSSAIYSGNGISIHMFGAADTTFGGGTSFLGYRGVGAATALGKDAHLISPFNVDHIVTAMNPGSGVQYIYKKVPELIPDFFPMANGGVIEPKRNPAAVLAYGIGTVVPAVLDAAGLSFPVNGLPLADGVANAPHNGTTYNSNFMRIGTESGDKRLKISNNLIEIADNNPDITQFNNTSIGGGGVTITSTTGITTISARDIGFSGGSISTEFPGSFPNISQVPARMVSAMYSSMNSAITTQKKYSMVVEGSAGQKVFKYPQYISPGNHHRFPLENPNGVVASNNSINAFTVGNTTSGIYVVASDYHANFATFRGALKVIPFETSCRLFLNFDFIDGLNYFAVGSTRYIFISNQFEFTDTVQFVRYHRHETEPMSAGSLKFSALMGVCTIIQTNAANNFTQRMLVITAPTGTGTRRGIVEILITRPSLYDAITAENVISTR